MAEPSRLIAHDGSSLCYIRQQHSGLKSTPPRCQNDDTVNVPEVDLQADFLNSFMNVYARGHGMFMTIANRPSRCSDPELCFRHIILVCELFKTVERREPQSGGFEKPGVKRGEPKRPKPNPRGSFNNPLVTEHLCRPKTIASPRSQPRRPARVFLAREMSSMRTQASFTCINSCPTSGVADSAKSQVLVKRSCSSATTSSSTP